MKKYLWKVEYDVVHSIRHIRTSYVVTDELAPGIAETIFMKGAEDIDVFDFIRSIEFEREVIS